MNGFYNVVCLPDVRHLSVVIPSRMNGFYNAAVNIGIGYVRKLSYRPE